jgi:hypothetical protein
MKTHKQIFTQIIKEDNVMIISFLIQGAYNHACEVINNEAGIRKQYATTYHPDGSIATIPFFDADYILASAQHLKSTLEKEYPGTFQSNIHPTTPPVHNAHE